MTVGIARDAPAAPLYQRAEFERARRCWTEGELANRAGIGRATYDRLATQAAPPLAKTVGGVCRALDIDLAEGMSLSGYRIGRTVSHDDIRQRLAAIEHIDWSKIKHEDEGEICADWIRIDDKVLLYGGAEEQSLAEFMTHAPADLRRLLADLDHATTTREAIMPSTNAVDGPPPDPERGEPARYLADAVEVQRSNGDVVVMDLVALADAAVNADRAVAGLRKENDQLRRWVAALEEKVSRIERAGRILAGEYEQ